MPEWYVTDTRTGKKRKATPEEIRAMRPIESGMKANGKPHYLKDTDMDDTELVDILTRKGKVLEKILETVQETNTDVKIVREMIRHGKAEKKRRH